MKTVGTKPKSGPSLSVCIPTYNRGSMLAAAIDSLLDQDFKDYELIIVDNASTDNTREILEKYTDPRIRVVRNHNTVSMYANHNICVDHARADWVVFLHSDDEMLTRGLSVLYQYIKEFPGYDVYFPVKDIHHTCNEGTISINHKRDLTQLIRWPSGVPSGTAYNTKTLKSIPFNEETVIADFEFLMRLVYQGGSILIIPDKTVNIKYGVQQCTHAVAFAKGGFVPMIAEVIKPYIKDKDVYEQLLKDINWWGVRDINRLLEIVAYMNDKQKLSELICINKINEQTTFGKLKIRGVGVHVYLFFGYEAFKLFYRLRGIGRRFVSEVRSGNYMIICSHFSFCKFLRRSRADVL